MNKKTAKKDTGFKPSAGTQAKMRRLREAVDEIGILEKRLATVKGKRDTLTSDLHHVMRANGLTTMAGNGLTLYTTELDVYSVTDGAWGKVEAYVSKNKAFDLYQRRISVTACKERFGNKPPKFLQHKIIPKLGVRKSSKK